jgi:adenylosuccinate synthase
MKPGTFNVVTDGQWGSCGKGHTTIALAEKFRPDIIGTTNMANAGHTACGWTKDEVHVAKALPSAAILARWLATSTRPYWPDIYVGATAAFNLQQMLKEIEVTGCRDRLHIHPRAGVITEAHRYREDNGTQSSVRHIASTMQGCGEFLADKILRCKDLRLARDYEELQSWIFQEMHLNLAHRLKYGRTYLHEGAQGFSLDISHGSHYPECTSRGTTAIQNLADMGVAPKYLGNVYLVIRPYPIRVGNVEGGHSGGCYPDQKETSWHTVALGAEMTMEQYEHLHQSEVTTVTKRQRRVFTFSPQQVKEAAIVNGATQIVVNFADQIDIRAKGCNSWQSLPPKVHKFIHMVEQITGVPVTMVGTGPKIGDYCWRR